MQESTCLQLDICSIDVHFGSTHISYPSNPKILAQTICPSQRFPETQNILVRILEFKGVETVFGVRERFAERQSTRLKLGE